MNLIPSSFHIIRHKDTAKFPSKAHEAPFADAGYDLYATEDIIIPANSNVVVPTGLSILIPDGYWAQVRDRSGNAAKHGLTILAGVIDSGWTGEWGVVIHNTTNMSVTIPYGKAIAQFTLHENLGVMAFVDITDSPAAIEAFTNERTRKTSGYGSSDVPKN